MRLHKEFENAGRGMNLSSSSVSFRFLIKMSFRVETGVSWTVILAKTDGVPVVASKMMVFFISV